MKCSLCHQNEVPSEGYCKECSILLHTQELERRWYLCQQEARASEREQLYTIQFSSNEVHFPCRTCKRMLELKKPELGVTSNTFCPGCDRQYWCDWQAGVLHMGLDNHDARMMDQVTGTLRMNMKRRVL